MRLAVHAGTLRGFGSGVVGRAILEALRKVPEVDALMALVPSEWPEGWPPSARDGAEAPLTLHTLRPGFRHKLLGENLTLRRRLISWRADALLSLTDTSLLLCPVPHVLMVQQGFVAYAPERLGFDLAPEVARRFRMMAAYLKLGLSHVDRVSVQTEHMKREFCSRWAYPSEHVEVIPSTIQPGARALSQGPLVAPSDPPFLAYVSGPGPHKNHAVLAPMMAALKARHPRLKCVLTLDKASVPELVAAAKAASVLDRFDFAGSLAAEQAMARLSTASVAVLPSRIESFGIPYHEAMALGVPAVASDVPCAREALGDTALYAPVDDGAGWAECVSRTLAEREVRAKAARERFNRIAASWDEIAAAYVRLVSQAIGRR